MCPQDYSIDCGSPEHQSYDLFATALLLVFPIGTPLVTGIMLWRSRDRINPPNADSEADAITTRMKQPHAGLCDLVEAVVLSKAFQSN